MTPDVLPLSAATDTITIDAETSNGWVRLELTRDQSVALSRAITEGWLPYR